LEARITGRNEPFASLTSTSLKDGRINRASPSQNTLPSRIPSGI
jgi:hypothetical protein